MKVLIWDNFELQNTGGPSGYLYNIHEYIKDHPNNSIVFLSDLKNSITNTSTTKSDSSLIENNSSIVSSKKPLFIKRIWHLLLKLTSIVPSFKSFITKSIDYAYRMYHIKWDKNGIESFASLNDYDFIHFHFLIHARQFRNTFPYYKGKTIVTSHTPSPWTEEMIMYDKSIRWLKPIMILQECKMYKSADYVMFPCKYAKEPYEHNKPIKKTLDKLESQTFYVPSSIFPYTPIKTESSLREQCSLPESTFIVAFFGRHNHVKGYDILKNIAVKTFENSNNIHFVCAGKGDIAPLNHPQWKELGFVSNIKDIMPQCDLYVLPNRDTYFDLVVIECLRAGLPIALTNTGGNIFFKSLPENETKGIMFFEKDDPNEAVNIITQLTKTKSDDINRYNHLRELNKELYQKYFTPEKYIEKYINSLKSLN